MAHESLYNMGDAEVRALNFRAETAVEAAGKQVMKPRVETEEGQGDSAGRRRHVETTVALDTAAGS
jgi:hypothetical protein